MRCPAPAGLFFDRALTRYSRLFHKNIAVALQATLLNDEPQVPLSRYLISPALVAGLLIHPPTAQRGPPRQRRRLRDWQDRSRSQRRPGMQSAVLLYVPVAVRVRPGKGAGRAS